jgi:D-alanyl-D-alanine carboxypeptidase (penicillin-binding protein 5/6)
MQVAEGQVGTVTMGSGAEAGATPLVLPGPVDITSDVTTMVPAVTSPVPESAGSAADKPTGPDHRLTRKERKAQRRHSHRRLWWSIVGLIVIALVAAGVVTVRRITQPLPPPRSVSVLAARLTVPGTAPALPWPVVGQGAVSIPALGFAEQSGPEPSVPIASLTKMTNAVVILRDHPLAPGTDGPLITVTAGDVGQYQYDLANDESNIPIQLGETLSERQMLEALLTQSANDIAYSLAVWDAGSEPAFVTKMNALAVSLGATHTHYADSSGYLPQSVSTAADCLRIAAAGMSIPAFAEIVDLSTVSLPLVGTAPNIVTEIGANGVVGIKSGYTSEAGGCMVLALYRTIDGRSTLVLASALDQAVPPPVAPTTTTTNPGTAPKPAPPSTTTTTTEPYNDLEIEFPLRYTGPVVEKLLDATAAGVVPVTLSRPGQAVGTVTARWDGEVHSAQTLASGRTWMMGWPGQTVLAAARFTPVHPGARAGSRAGTAVYALGTQFQAVPLTLAADLPEPSWWGRLAH